MTKKLPQLGAVLPALRFFKAVADRMSFRQAAEDLNVTHSAVSHHIRVLEDRLGTKLFDRTNRQITLTDSGRTLLPFINEGFDRLEAGIAAATARNSDDELVVQTYITVAMHWLLPRFHRFAQKNPDIKVKLFTSTLGWGFDMRSADLGLIYPRQDQSNLHVEALCKAKVYPVCTPDLAEQMETPRDLLVSDDIKLLSVLGADEDWHCWFQAAGLAQKKASSDLEVDNYMLAQEAATQGAGVALCLAPFASESHFQGRLIRPFKADATLPNRWSLVCQAKTAERPAYKAFAEWIREELRSPD